jgi:hypothetical protein
VSVLWTGVAWHALISVLVGWHLMRLAIQDPRPAKVAAWSAGLGAFWGSWATFLWRETPPIVASVPAFAAHAAVCTALLALSYAAVLRFPMETYRPGWAGLALSLLVLAAFYSQQLKSLGWRPLLVLPGLVAVALAALYLASRNRFAPSPRLLSADPFAIARNLAWVFLMPATATALYAVQLATRFTGIEPILIYRAMIWLGGALLAWAVVSIVLRRRSGA